MAKANPAKASQSKPQTAPRRLQTGDTIPHPYQTGITCEVVNVFGDHADVKFRDAEDNHDLLGTFALRDLQP